MKINRIFHITPGLLPIPPNGWGATEKIIWEYHQNLLKLGCDSQIIYLDDFNYKKGDIVHIHVANLALLAKERGIPYYFTCHDHHAYLYGKKSKCFQENYESIKHSIKSFVPANYLVNYFDLPNLYYLSHGVNTEIFKNINKNFKNHKLLCVANNGFLHDQSEDRKGFSFAIKAAKLLNLPITIAGPKNNKNFFDSNIFNYDKLEIKYDLDEKSLVELYQDHTIFLHPSILEAGHPNLTLLEAMSCGLPVIGTFEDHQELNGLFKIKRSVDSVINGLLYVIKNYTFFKDAALQTSNQKNWNKIVKKLLDFYNTEDSIMKHQLETIYAETKINFSQDRPLNVLSLKNKYDDDITATFFPSPKIEILGSNQINYKIKFIDKQTENNEYESEISTNMWSRCDIKRFCDWRISVENLQTNELKYYDFDASNKRIKIINESPSLGDLIAWVPYVEEFRKKNNCKVDFFTVNKDIFEKSYPEINFKDYDAVDNGDYYTSYTLGFYLKDQNLFYKNDIRTLNLQKIACETLGLEYREIKPKLNIEFKAKRNIQDKYVCIATQSTAQCKYWNNKTGWAKTVEYLKQLGYKVVCIDKFSSFGAKDNMNLIPEGCINDTGDKHLNDRINTLLHCDFFIGLSSGLSWLAWLCDKPVILISGFTKEFNEFNTPYRVLNEKVCNGCFNDTSVTFDPSNWLWCPKNKNFECSKEITFEMVKEKVDECIKNMNGNNKQKHFNWGSTDNFFKQSNCKEVFEEKIYEKFFTVEKDDIVLDLGASVGSFTYSILENNPKKCYVVEAMSNHIDLLKENLNTSAVQIIHGAITDKKNIDITWSGITEKVPTFTFEELLKKHNISKIDFLKCDCEGGEYEVFQEKNISFLKTISKIVVEFHLRDNAELHKYKFKWFRDKILPQFLNYKVYSLDSVDIKWDLYNDHFLNYYNEVMFYIDNR